MKFLVIGLGSMGKRRIRCLKNLGYNEIYGFDIKSNRIHECKKKYKIYSLPSYRTFLRKKYFDAVFVCTDPLFHFKYSKEAVLNKTNCFVEASVVNSSRLKSLKKIISQHNLVYAPSCTMRYYPLPLAISNNIRRIGKLLYLNYHVGQYLPDWHPWEDYKKFYVSRKTTGAVRELIPFELNWINSLLGNPKLINCYKSKIGNLPINIDDIYIFTLRYPLKIIVNVTIEVHSRPLATRKLTAIGSLGKLSFDNDNQTIKIYSIKKNNNKIIKLRKNKIEKNYINPEQPYINEVKDFIRAIKSKNKFKFPTDLEWDLKLLKTLDNLDKISKLSK
jgi:predicted dehydrogenase